MLSKLEKLSHRQDKPLRETNKIAVKTLDGIELPVFVNEMLSYGPKHPVRDKFNEIHLLADVDKQVRSLRENGTSGEKLCEIDSTAKWYAKNMRETPIDRGLVNVNKYLKENKLLAVPFDKGNGFCVMKKESYDKKLLDVLNCPQFKELEDVNDSIVMKVEKEVIRTLLEIKKQELIS